MRATPLRLPPYHCQLNPIELVWAEVKKEIAKNNFNCTKQQFECLIFNSLDKISTQYWQNCIRHVTKIEGDYIISDKTISDIMLDHNYCLNAN